MLELDITEFFVSEDAYYFSASRFEMGDDAGAITWNNAKREANTYLHWLAKENSREIIISYFKDMGFSESADMAEWPDTEIVALLIQLISGDIREADLDNERFEDIDWQEYEQKSAEGCISGNLFYVPETGKVYYSIY